MKKRNSGVVSFSLVSLFVLSVAGAFFFPPAFAGSNTQTGVMSVAADLNPTCTVSNGIIQFGPYSTGVAETAQGTIPISCNEGVVATVGLDNGANGNNVSEVLTPAHPITRAMNDAGGNWIGYDLFYDAADQTAFTNAWNLTTDYVTVYFGNMSGYIATSGTTAPNTGNQIVNGFFTANSGPLAAAGTPGVTFTQVATGSPVYSTSSTGQSPTVISTGGAAGFQSVSVTIYGAIPAGQTQAQGNGAYLDYVGAVMTF